MFQPVSSKVSFPAMEEDVLRLWAERDVFARSVRERPEDRPFVMYEGPPTANGSPGIHHVLARVFKDIIPRYKTMKGYRVLRKGGWDTHGLPVELEVEKELGIKSKPEIERYGVARFNERCRESVMRYVKEWEDLTRRIAFWVDMEHPYRTYDNDYIETGWWIIKQLWEKGLVYQGYRVTPHCPRCGTSVSSHEVALGYEDDVPDPSIFIRFRLGQRTQPQDPPRARADKLGWDYQGARWREERPSFLAWTTTPWTLTANMALAVAPEETYALVQTRSSEGVAEKVVMASKKALLDQALGVGNWEVLLELPGSELAGLLYEPLYGEYRSRRELVVQGEAPSLEENTVLPADFVSMTEGTGIVHSAPAFGEEDYQLGLAHGLPVLQTVDLEGNLRPVGRPWDGKFVKEADPLILADLRQRGLLYRQGTIHHTYPFCWRCKSPLLYYAKSSWYIRTTAAKERLISGNQEINWYPEHIKEGRFGDWLRNNVDWAISRERYWGTPLPVWRCRSCGHQECVGSRQELKARLGVQGWKDGLDLHRPHIDEVTFSCPRCDGAMARVPEVMDCWFDSGAMPYAQWHYPFENNEKQSPPFFPADYICEAVDQTRGWFYTLHALATLISGQPCYRNVICLGLVLDEKGEKMSKSRGNIVEPGPVIEKWGADAVRWYLYTASPAGNPRRFSSDLVAEALRRFLLTLWNTYSFFVTYANIDKFDPHSAASMRPESDLDRWIISELNLLVARVEASLEGYDPTTAGRSIEAFVDNLSNWYVRRSRRRFWKSENDADKLSAHATLYRCLVTLSRLLAPFTPFVAEAMYQNLVRSVDEAAPDSVHLAGFPQADLSEVDEELTRATRLVMKLSSLGRAARNQASLKVRQPLARAMVRLREPAEEAVLHQLAPQLQDELNVKDVALLEDDSPVVEWRVKPNLPVLGPKYGRELPRVVAALGRADARALSSALEADGEVQVEGYRFSAQEVSAAAQPKPGYALATEGGYMVAVETGLTPDLVAEGLAREVVHRLQTMRKEAGFDIADHIVSYLQGDDLVGQAVRQFQGYVRQETLSDRLVEDAPPAGAYVQAQRLDGKQVTLAVMRA